MRQLSQKNATPAIFLGSLRAKVYQKISEPLFGKFVSESEIQVRTLFSMKYLTYQNKTFSEKTVSNVLVSFLNYLNYVVGLLSMLYYCLYNSDSVTLLD